MKITIMMILMIIIITVIIMAIMIMMIEVILIIAVVIINNSFQPGDFSTGSNADICKWGSFKNSKICRMEIDGLNVIRK